MKPYFAYIRISTEKQGDGVSLAEQRAAIEAFADGRGLRISEWFEERQTAAKKGRPVFTEVLRRLRRGQGGGLLMHKIDRSSRNFHDWARLCDLVDDGVDVQFVHDQLDLNTRGGRITADIQAVIAADYVRNLREEARKGIYGRYKQGFLPHGSPIGYLDQGGGKSKIVDPEKGPLVRRAFELYATGDYSLRRLCEKMADLGLTNNRGNPVLISGMSTMLKNPFYTGVVVYKRTGEVFQGQHEALIDPRTFRIVQARLAGKLVKRISKHDFTYRKLLRCALCSRFLIGERQKGHVYYRCHNRDCPTTTIREDTLEQHLDRTLGQLRIGPDAKKAILEEATRLNDEAQQRSQERASTTEASLARTHDQLAKLTAAFLSGEVDATSYEVTKQDLLRRRARLQAAADESETKAPLELVSETLELAETAQLSYRSGDPELKLETIRAAFSNLQISGREPLVELRKPFWTLANSACVLFGGDERAVPRTCDPNRLAREILNIDEAA